MCESQLSPLKAEHRNGISDIQLYFEPQKKDHFPASKNIFSVDPLRTTNVLFGEKRKCQWRVTAYPARPSQNQKPDVLRLLGSSWWHSISRNMLPGHTRAELVKVQIETVSLFQPKHFTHFTHKHFTFHTPSVIFRIRKDKMKWDLNFFFPAKSHSRNRTL